MNVLFWIANGRQPEARMTATQEKYVRSFLLLAQLRIFIFLGHCCTAQSPPFPLCMPFRCLCDIILFSPLRGYCYYCRRRWTIVKHNTTYKYNIFDKNILTRIVFFLRFPFFLFVAHLMLSLCIFFFLLRSLLVVVDTLIGYLLFFSVKLNFAAGDRAVEKSECHFVKSSPAELSWTPHDRFSFVSVVFVVVVVVTVPGCPRIRHLRSWSISNRSSVRSFRNDWTTQRLGRENQYKLITIISKLYTLNGK